MGLTDHVLAFGRIVSDSVDRTLGAILLQVTGHPGYADDESTDDKGEGEQDARAPQFSALGVVGRVLPKSKLKLKDAFVEAIVARFGDSLIPLVVRDLRINFAAFPNGLAEGQTGIAGYGGASVTFSLNQQGESIATLYLPYQRNSQGVPQRCHAAIFDPDPAKGITIAHGDGYAIVMNQDGLTLRSETGEARITLKGDQITGQAANIIWQGNVVVGANPETAQPVGPGTTTLPSTSFRYSTPI